MKIDSSPKLISSSSHSPLGLSAFDQMLEDYQAEKDYQAEEKAKVEAGKKAKVEAEEREKFEAKEKEIASLRDNLATEIRRIQLMAETLQESRKVNEEQKAKIGRQGAIITAGFIGMVFLGLFSPVSHRLSPDIGNEHEVSGRIFRQNHGATIAASRMIGLWRLIIAVGTNNEMTIKQSVEWIAWLEEK